MSGERAVVLLGPQRLRPTVIEAVHALALSVDAPIATVTAGWQEREPDDQELDEHLGGRSVNLQLYRRVERAFHRDPELAEAHHHRQRLLRELQLLYDLRLEHAMAACRALQKRAATDLVRAELDGAIEALRGIDARHLNHVREIDAEFDSRWRPPGREAIAAERQELTEALRPCVAVAVAGGHVAVLLNRLRLLGLASLLGERPVIAWSAGAMALSDRVVLFHDDPPHGPGNAEVLEAGLGLAPGVVALPHARRRLRLDDAARVGLMARRFAPAACFALEDGAVLRGRGASWEPGPGALALGPDGVLAAERAA